MLGCLREEKLTFGPPDVHPPAAIHARTGHVPAPTIRPSCLPRPLGAALACAVLVGEPAPWRRVGDASRKTQVDWWSEGEDGRGLIFSVSADMRSREPSGQ